MVYACYSRISCRFFIARAKNMQFFSRIIARNPPSSYCSSANILSKTLPLSSCNLKLFRNARVFSSESEGGNGSESAPFSWNDSVSSWSTGLTKDHFDGKALGRKVSSQRDHGGGGGGRLLDPEMASVESEAALERAMKERLQELKRDARAAIQLRIDDNEMYEERMNESMMLWKQITEPGARGAPLKDSEKAKIYRLHKENPEVNTVEQLAKDFRIMRQRVVAILWLKEQEEEAEKKLGMPLDDTAQKLIDTYPDYFSSHDREFHVASLPYKPEFKVMSEGWDGITKDPDEVHYEISKKEEDMLYGEFLQRFNFNTLKFKGEVKVHRYSRRRPSDGWSFTVEKLGSRGKRGGGGGWKFVSEPDGSTRALNETEKMYVKRETPRRRQRILP